MREGRGWLLSGSAGGVWVLWVPSPAAAVPAPLPVRRAAVPGAVRPRTPPSRGRRCGRQRPRAGGEPSEGRALQRQSFLPSPPPCLGRARPGGGAGWRRQNEGAAPVSGLRAAEDGRAGAPRQPRETPAN